LCIELAQRSQKRFLYAETILSETVLIDSGYHCAVCGEWNETTVDASAGLHQTYIEDCFVCCHPNTLYITIDDETDSAEIVAVFEE
jgi:hypothetical protein